MPRPFRAFLTGSAFLFLAQGASAQLAAEDVWTDWQTYIESFGYEVAGRETRDGDRLVISGVTMTVPAEDGSEGTTIALDRIVMTEADDGTVRIDLPAVMPMTFAAPAAEGGTMRVSMDYRQRGLDIVASGTKEALDYTYAAEEISLETTGIEMDGAVLPAETNLVTFSLSEFAGTSRSRHGDAFRYAQDLSAAALSYRLVSSIPESGSQSEIAGQSQAVSFTGETVLPRDTGDTGSMTEMLDAGLSTSGTFGFATNAATLLVTAPEGTSEAAFTGLQGRLGVVMDRDGVTYDLGQDDLQAEISTVQVPLPLSFSAGRAVFNLTMPLRKSDTPDDFALGLLLDEFTLPDMLWGMFDPGAQLPRDPATVALDVAGTVRLLFDFLDPAEATAFSPEAPPVDFETLDLRRLRVSALGAELTGSGAFTFAETPSESAPTPVGAVNLLLTGANTLIDRLIATGLLPEQDAMGVRMMLGLLAMPGAAPDTLTSRIEFNDEGHVIANGQRIR